MSNIDKDIKRQVVNTMEYYKNIDNLEEIPIDILRVMYKDNLSELEEKDKKLAEYRKFHDRRLKAWKKKFEKQEEIFLGELDERDNDLETWKKIAEKPTIEFAKELNKASLVMLDGRFIGGERERVLRFYKPEDIGVDIKVNEVGKDVQLNEKIFHSDKHFLELKFYHNESIDALIHRLEHLKTL